MREVTVSSKGQVVLPADLRRRLGMGAGAKLEIVEGEGGITLRVIRSQQSANVAALAGMVKAESKGRPRSLDEFDAASLLTRSTRD